MESPVRATWPDGTPHNTTNVQELKSVNAKESTALAQAFVSKEFLEVQVEKGNMDDVVKLQLPFRFEDFN